MDKLSFSVEKTIEPTSHNRNHMQKDPLISIVVPVYNAENYLNVCVNSIIQQTYKNFECILINDGSADNSGALCDNYASVDNRFKVIHKLNGGVGNARNHGLEIAMGDWITFIDSDDWIETEYLNEFVKATANVDLIIQGHCKYINSKKAKIFSPSNWVASGNEITTKIVEVYKKINPFIIQTPWSKFYKSSIIENNQLRFNESMRIGEDYLFLLNYLLYINNVRAISYSGYNYATYQSTLTKLNFSTTPYFEWQKNLISSLIEVDAKYEHHGIFADFLIADRLQSLTRNSYLTNKNPRKLRLEILTLVVSLLSPTRIKYIEKKCFALKLYKVMSVRALDSILYLYLHVFGSFFRMLYHKIKR